MSFPNKGSLEVNYGSLCVFTLESTLNVGIFLITLSIRKRFPNMAALRS